MENPDPETAQSYDALSIAYKTMTERCQQLEKRLTTMEDESLRLRLKLVKEERPEKPTNVILKSLQGRIEELTLEKSQLTYNLSMVAGENRQLWTRLNKLMKSNKSLGNRLNKISDTLKPHNHVDNQRSSDEERSFQEISLRLIDNIMLEKSNLEQQCEEMSQLTDDVEFAYPDTDSSDRLKQLTEMKETLIGQQRQLKTALENFQKLEKETKKSINVGTQMDSNQPPPPSSSDTSIQTCPICGISYGSTIPFLEFHEHVVNHFM